MSSPLSSLKKGRRPALPGTVPFRSSIDPGIVSYNEEDRKLLDEIVESMSSLSSKKPASNSHITSSIKSSAKSSESATSGESVKEETSDYDLMMMMTKKISELECHNQAQNKLIYEKEKTIHRLEYKLSIIQKSQGSDMDKINILEKRCLNLQQQVFEMEEFLSDYGMIWVGNRSGSGSEDDDDEDINYNTINNDDDNDNDNVNDDEDNDNNQSNDHKNLHSISNSRNSTRRRKSGLIRGNKFWDPANSLVEPHIVNFDRIIDNIKQLNILAGEGVARIQRTNDGARLKMTDSVELVLYVNGLMLFSGPFRSYEDPSTQQFIQDLEDGYFPSELKEKYPEGVPFRVTDRREMTYKDRLTQIFQGEGRVLGAGSAVQTTGEERTTQKLNNKDVELSRERFLQKIPRSVIKEGKVIDIREPVSERLRGQDEVNNQVNNPVIVADTPALRLWKERISSGDVAKGVGSRPKSGRGLTTLRVKSESGDQTYVLKMNYSDTISDVKICLDNLRPGVKSKYTLRSTFPPRSYEDESRTLEQCGLIPSATLYLIHGKL